MKKIILILLILIVVGLFLNTRMNLFGQNTITRIDESNYFSNGTKTYYVMSNTNNSSDLGGVLGDSKHLSNTLSTSTTRHLHVQGEDALQFYDKNAVIVSPKIFLNRYKLRNINTLTIAIELSINCSGTLKTINENYTQINTSIFYKEKIIEGAIPKTFTVLENDYSKDAKSVFFESEKIAVANPSTFENINNYYYAKDDNYVYKRGEIFNEADPETFEFINFRYQKDKNHVWIEGNVTKLDPSTLRSLKYISNNFNKEDESWYLVDSNHVYYFDRIIPKADAKTFHLPFSTRGYGIDENHVYSGANVIPQADLISFRTVNSGYSIDKNHVYYYEKIIPQADPKSFHIPSTDTRYSLDKIMSIITKKLYPKLILNHSRHSPQRRCIQLTKIMCFIVPKLYPKTLNHSIYLLQILCTPLTKTMCFIKVKY